MPTPPSRTDSTLVIGLGRFGSAVAATLDRLGREVLAVEANPAIVRQWTGRIPLVEADATDVEALEQLGATEFGTAVVGVATSLEASVLITGNLVDLETPQIWAKAISRAHGRILRRIGAQHVVYPEFDAGQRAAHLVSGRMLDYIEMEKGGFTIVKMRPPTELHGFTIGQSKVRSVKVTLSSDWEVGASRAPKQPWATRATSRMGKEVAIPAARLATPKPISPTW